MKEIEGTESRKLGGKVEVGSEQEFLNRVSWATQLPGREGKEKQNRQAETLPLALQPEVLLLSDSCILIRNIFPSFKGV